MGFPTQRNSNSNSSRALLLPSRRLPPGLLAGAAALLALAPLRRPWLPEGPTERDRERYRRKRERVGAGCPSHCRPPATLPEREEREREKLGGRERYRNPHLLLPYIKIPHLLSPTPLTSPITHQSILFIYFYIFIFFSFSFFSSPIY